MSGDAVIGAAYRMVGALAVLFAVTSASSSSRSTQSCDAFGVAPGVRPGRVCACVSGVIAVESRACDLRPNELGYTTGGEEGLDAAGAGLGVASAVGPKP